MLGPLLLILGEVLVVIAGAALGWYPARIGGPSYWLVDHLYGWPVSLLSRAPNWPVEAGILFTLALALGYGGYVLGMRWAIRRGAGGGRDLARIVVVQGLVATWLAFQPYLSSQDIFSYAFYSRILVLYHANPYVWVPRDFPFDPLFQAIFWKDQPSNYGPVWTYLSALAPILAGSRTGATLLLLKVIAVVACMAGTPIVWNALGTHDRQRRVLGAVLYAWNPLLLIESAVAGHNDAVMAFFLILGAWAWVRGHRSWAVGSLVLAGLTKYVAFLVVPFFVISWLRRRGESPAVVLARVVLVGGGLTVVAFAPLYDGPQTVGIVGFGTNALAYSNSPLELAFRQIRVAFGESPDLAELPMHYQGYWIGANSSTILWTVPDPTRGTGIALPHGEPLVVVSFPGGQWLHVFEARVGRFGYVQLHDVHPIATPRPASAYSTTLAVLLGAADDSAAQRGNALLRALSGAILLFTCLLLLRRVRDDRSLFGACLLVLLVYLTVVQSWFWPWYLIWALPFAALIPKTSATRVLVTLTATSSVLNAQPGVNPGPLIEWLYEARVIAIDGIPLVVAAVAWWAARRSPGWRIPQVQVRMRSGALIVVVLVIVSVGIAIWSTSASAGDSAVIVWQREFGEAQRNFSAGNDEATVHVLDRVLADRPREMSAVTLRLAANLDMRRYEDAIPDVSTLLADDSSDVSLVLERGTLYAQIQRDDLALADFMRSVALAPTNPSGYQGAGLAEYARGDLAPAQLWLARAADLSPDDGLIARQLATVLSAQGRIAEARDLYDQAIALDPSDAQTYADRAALLRYAGFEVATEPDLRHVLVLSGDVQEHAWAAHLLGRLIGLPTRSVEWTE